MPGYEHAFDPAHTVTGHRLEQRLEQARDLVRRVFRVSRLLSSSATKKVFGPYRSKNCDSTSRHAASSMAAQAETATTSQPRAGARIGTLTPLRPLAVAARSSTLQSCSQSTSSTESTVSKSAGSQPMSQGSTSITLDLPAAGQVMPTSWAWLAMLPLSTAALRRNTMIVEDWSDELETTDLD